MIEDEVRLAEYLRKGLTEEGFVVDIVHNGVDGLHLAMEGAYDLLLLDGMLPGIDGLGVLAALRQSKQTPVLMLTARRGVEDRVTGTAKWRRRLPRQAFRIFGVDRPDTCLASTSEPFRRSPVGGGAASRGPRS